MKSIKLTVLLVSFTCGTVQADLFSWADYGLDIANVQGGDSFFFANVDGSGIDFTFTFNEQFGAGSTITQTIINPTNTAPDFPANFTGNGNIEGIYANDPLYAIGEGSVRNDAVIMTITTSERINLTDMLVGDIDRLGSTDDTQSFEDLVTFSASLKGFAVTPTLSTTSTTLTVSGTTVSARSGGLLTSTNGNSQVLVSANDVNSISILYRNDDLDGQSNSHWITFGDDASFFSFSTLR